MQIILMNGKIHRARVTKKRPTQFTGK